MHQRLSCCRSRLGSSVEDGWRLVVSHRKGFRANIILWVMPMDVSMLKVRSKLADLGLASFER